MVGEVAEGVAESGAGGVAGGGVTMYTVHIIIHTFYIHVRTYVH